MIFRFFLKIALLFSVLLQTPFAVAENLHHFDGSSNYTINVILDADRKFFVATERISWKNNSTVSASSLIFSLPWNDNRNDKNSTNGIREKLISIVGEYSEGSISISKITIPNGPDITHLLSSGENTHETELKLPGRIGPGEIIELEVEYKADIPERFEGSGFSDDFAIASGWYPKISGFVSGASARIDTDKSLASYTVHLTLPNEFTPAATGELRNKVRNGLHTTYTFYQENTGDFVWSFDSDFVVHSRIIYQDEKEAVHISLFMQPGRESDSERILNIIETSIKSAESCFGKYINPTFTVVDVPVNLTHITGLDYQTFITICSSNLSGLLARDSVSDIVIGIGSQYMISSECSDSRDLAVAQSVRLFAESRVYDAVAALEKQSERVFSLEFLKSDFLNIPYCKNIFDLGPASLCFDSELCALDSEFRSNCTPAIRGALFLKTFENIFGRERVDSIIRECSATGTAEGLFERLKARLDNSGWEGAFEEYLFRGANLDIAISAPDENTPKFIRTDNGASAGESFIIRKNSTVSIPVEILIEYSNGETTMQTWTGDGLEKTFMTNNDNVKSVIIDPDNKLAIDSNRINNRLDFHTPAEVKVNWIQLIVSWLQNANQTIVMLF